VPAQGIHIRRAGNPQREGRPAEDKKLRAHPPPITSPMTFQKTYGILKTGKDTGTQYEK